MRRTRRALLASIPAGVALAGCLGDDDDAEETPTPTPSEDPTPSPTPTPTPGASLTLDTVLDQALGRIVVDGEGMVLYMFDSDEQGAGESTCGEGCVENWPPVTVDGDIETDDTVEGEVTTFEREDGTQQVALDGWPLYYWMGDEEPGDTNGQGVNDVWWVIRGDGTPVREEGTPATVVVDVAEHADHGEILVDADGLTLYNFDQDEQGAGASACGEGCVGNWPPLTVDTDEIAAGEGVEADLTTFEREDGSTQVAANGWPLYYWMGDEAAGDANGHAVNDVWWVLDAAGQPQRDGEEESTAATVEVADHPDLGEILVDQEGYVLYNFDADEQGAGESACGEGCVGNWPPLTVGDGDPVGGDGVTAELTSFERSDGDVQVAAEGWPLYYFAADGEPGEAGGHGANDVWWVVRPDGSIVRDDGGDDNGSGPGY